MLKAVIFGIIAVFLIWGGMWYNNRIDQQAADAQSARVLEARGTREKEMESLGIKDVVVGTGVEAKARDTVMVHYTGTFDDGRKFDSSYDHGEPFEFQLGTGNVIRGWDLGVAGMKVGGKRELTILPELGYGTSGSGPIPPNATLHFIVELLGIK